MSAVCGWCGAPAQRRVDDPRLHRYPEYICEGEWAELPEDEQAEWVPVAGAR